MATVVLLGALDTKGDEYAFIRDRVINAGCDVVMINAGVLGDPRIRLNSAEQMSLPRPAPISRPSLRPGTAAPP